MFDGYVYLVLSLLDTLTSGCIYLQRHKPRMTDKNKALRSKDQSSSDSKLGQHIGSFLQLIVLSDFLGEVLQRRLVSSHPISKVSLELE